MDNYFLSKFCKYFSKETLSNLEFTQFCSKLCSYTFISTLHETFVIYRPYIGILMTKSNKIMKIYTFSYND